MGLFTHKTKGNIENKFPSEFEIVPREDLRNLPQVIIPSNVKVPVDNKIDFWSDPGMEGITQFSVNTLIF